MSNPNDKKIKSVEHVAASWDTYWQGDHSSHAFSSSGVNHNDIDAWWKLTFEKYRELNNSPKVLDIASGNGALAEIAIDVFGQDNAAIVATDISAAAIANINKRFSSVTTVVADANQLPFEPHSFDLVTSQFGVEYAGLNAIRSAFSLVADNGFLVLMMHLNSGQIHRDCLANRDALNALDESTFIKLAHTMFEHGFKAVAGEERKSYDDAAAQLAPALQKVEAIIEQYGVEIAGGSIVKLYQDVGNIHSRMPNYRAQDVLPWLQDMQKELQIYAQRMDSMLAAAIEQNDFDEICENLLAEGFRLHDNAALFDRQTQQPLAWILRAQKS